jgi:hypothetical protein
MAAKKKAAKKAAPKKSAAKKAAPKKSDLGGFFRSLYKSPDRMQKFAAGGDSRKAVIANAKLSTEHQNVLAGGCIPDIIRALSGAPMSEKLGEASTVVNCEMDSVTCTHVECHAFSKA